MARDGSVVVPADPQGMTVVKKKTQSSRSWILFDGTGQGSLLDLDKYAIMHRVQIHARDLRILDPLLSYPSTILGRDKAIVLNLEHIKAIITAEEHIKAIITAEEVLLRDPTDENVIPVVEELQRRLPRLSDSNQQQGDESPFEFRALEVALEAICSFLAARTTELEVAAYPALDELTSKVRDELEQLLDDDDDMADLYLSRKASSSSPVSGLGAANWFAASPTIGSKISRASVTTARFDENDVEELEMLLELREYIDDTEDYINIQLDSHRNQLIQLELFLSSGTVCLSLYALVTSIFGMNIPYNWNQNHGYMFKWVVTVTGGFCALMFLMITVYARKKGLVGS
ncbi:hypothetical protein Fmac_015425 [Flemingia macrophylla]|uniref:Magnesium transporter n=1 Tax=Flemingia macrophylla TaxID=520843 RepID=A0ABD1MEJ5_9FABA